MDNTNPPVPRQRFTDLDGLSLSIQLGSFNSKILGWGFIKPQWWRNHLHTHSCFEVCYSYQGQGTFTIEGIDHPVRAGDTFIARPGEPHEIISSEADPLGIYFWTFTLSGSTAEASSPRGVDALLNAFIKSDCRVGTASPSTQTVLEMLTEEIVRKGAGYPQIIEGLLVKLLLDTARTGIDTLLLTDTVEPPIRTPAEALVQKVVRYLHDNYNRPISIKDIAAQVNLSERHVSRIFQKKLGISVVEYLTNLRMEAASQLLLEPHLTIKEVAQQTGYQDVRYFMTSFRKHSGLTPGTFRHKGGTNHLGKS